MNGPQDKWREVEQRIFQQKQLAYRLSTIYSQEKNIKDKDNVCMYVGITINLLRN